MLRRRFLGAMAGGLLVAARPAAAQPAPKPWRIGLVVTAPSLRDALAAGLRRLGYEEGRNLVIDWRRPAADDGGTDLEDLVREKVECLVLPGSLRVAHGRKLTSTIPIVAIDVETDPLTSGFVSSLARPGGNVTGIFVDFPELAGKQIQLLREVVPALKRLAVLWDERLGDAQLRAANAAAQAASVALIPAGIQTAADLDGAIARAVKLRPQALLMLTSPTFFPQLAKVAEDARKHRLPSASVFPAFGEAGGLIGYGPNLADLFREAAKFVDRVLKGAAPADLPIERPVTFELVVNLKTARALGVTVPPSLLGRADRVIQ